MFAGWHQLGFQVVMTMLRELSLALRYCVEHLQWCGHNPAADSLVRYQIWKRENTVETWISS
jgi:hypothetical protein